MRTLYTVLLILPLHFISLGQPPCDLLPADNQTLTGDCTNGIPFCINVSPTAFLDGDYSLQDNGFPYAGSTGNCNYIDEPYYNFTPLPNGEGGTYRLVNWPVNGGSFSAEPFNGLAELIDSMNLWDPSGNWYIDGASNEIKGGAAGHSYGDMVLEDLATNTNYNLGVQFYSTPNGTEILLTGGPHYLELINNLTQCKDSVWVNVDCAPFDLSGTQQILDYGCDSVEVCIPVNYDSYINGVTNIHLNGQALNIPYNICPGGPTLEAYDISSLTGPAPYSISNWLVGGSVYSGSFGDVLGLLAWMNKKDPDGDWILTDAAQIAGGVNGITYGPLQIDNGNDQSFTFNASDLLTANIRFTLYAGTHEIVAHYNSTGYSDTTYFTVNSTIPPINLVVTPTAISACAGDTILLSGVGNGDLEYWWTGENVLEPDTNVTEAIPYASGIYTLYATNCSGDTAFANVTFTLSPTNDIQLYEEACDGESVEYNGIFYTATTADTFYFTNTFGCDSIVYYDINFLEEYVTQQQLFVCTQDLLGEVRDTFISVGGCDSIIISNYIYDYQGDTTFVEITSCDPIDAGIEYETFTAVSGCDSTVQTTTIYEDLDPVAVCIDVIIHLDESGIAIIDAPMIDGGAVDDCTLTPLITIDQSIFDCSQTGVNPVTLTITDNGGNSATCVSNVTVVDDKLPIAICQDITFQLDEFGTAFLTPEMIDNGSTDNCSIFLSPTVDRVSFTCDDIGIQTVTLSLIDEINNTSMCTALVTIEDSLPPSLTCVDVTHTIPTGGSVTVTLAELYSIADDNCTLASISQDQNQFSCQDEGINEVNLTAVDINGNMTNCIAYVTINVDGETPTVIEEYTCDPNQAGSFPDTLINQFGCDSIVILNILYADLDPIAVCKDVTLYLDESGLVLLDPQLIDNSSVDDCSAQPSLSIDQSSFDCSQIGVNTLTLTATDDAGNTATCFSTVLVLDDKAPIANCQDIILELDSFGIAVLDPYLADNGSTDNCNGLLTFTADVSSFDCTNVGTFPFFIHVFDESQNMAECNVDITIEDNIAPTLTCQDIVRSLPLNETITIADFEVVTTATDNCGTPIVSLSQFEFNCQDAGINLITITAIDADGNFTTCEANVEIVTEDPAPMVIETTTCDQSKAGTNTETLTNQFGCDSIVVYNTIYVPGGDTTFVEMLTCITAEVGTTYEVFTDSEGCDSTVATIKIFGDEIPPTAVCRDFILQLDSTGMATLNVADIDGGSFDDCSQVSFDLSKNLFSCVDVGTNIVTLYVVDALGNMSTCEAIVTVEDNVAPVAVCQDIVVSVVPGEVKTIAEDAVNNGSTDECGSLTFDTDITSFDCTNSGINPVTLSVTDASGNVASCTANVEVITADPSSTYVDLFTCDQNEVGSITDTLMNQFGCDSLLVITTTHYNPISDTITIDTFSCITAEVGTFYDEVPNGDGCFTVVITNVEYLGNEPIYLYEYTCDSLAAGIFTTYETDAAGCEQEIITTVTWNGPPTEEIIEIVTCDQNAVGSVTESITDQNGCDSILIITNTIFENTTEPIYETEYTCDSLAQGTFSEFITDATGCQQEVITNVYWYGPVHETIIEVFTCDQNQVGSSTNVYQDQNGCDSLVITNTIYENTTEPIYETEYTCDSLAQGIFMEVIINQDGCEQEVITNVYWYGPVQETIIEVFTCDQNQVGSSTEVLRTENGCDSLIITNTIFSNDLPPITLVEYTCDSLAQGSFTEVIINEDGCEQEKITTVIWYGPIVETIIEKYTCDQNQVGAVTEKYVNNNGCDSLVTIVTIYENTTESIYIDEYTCNEAEVGTSTKVIINEIGCEQQIITSTHLLDNTQPIVIELTTCDQSQVGSVTETYTSSQGCDSTVVINTLYEYYADTTFVEIKTCDETLVGIDTKYFTGAAGCDSVVVTTIIYEPSPIVHIETKSCNPADVGDFTEVLQSIAGCDSTVIYHVLQDDCSGPIALNGIPTDVELSCGAALPLIPDNIYAESPNCPGDVSIEFSESYIDGDCVNNYTVERTWTAIDDCGNVETKTQVISITDKEAPIFVNAPVDLIVACGEDIELPQLIAEDNCDNEVEINFTEVKDNCDIIRTWSATDNCGNQKVHTQYITVTDNEAPVLSEIPADVTVRVTFGEEIPVDEVTSTDNCDSDVEVILEESETTISAGYIITRRWTAIDDCGNQTVSDERKIFVRGGPIWPGDTDSTNHVDVFDLFNIGFGWGQTGSARNNASTNWVAQYAPLWDDYGPFNNTNLRHADTNGDGEIDIKDVAVLAQNFGQSHGLQEDSKIPMVRNQFVVNLEAAEVTSDGWATIDILLKNDQQLVEDFYGVNLNLLFDNSKVVEGTMSISYDNSWIGTEGNDIITIEKEIFEEGRFEAAVVRTNQRGVDGIGRIGSLRFQVPQNTGGDFRIKIDEPIKVTSAGTGEQGESTVEEVDMTITSTKEIQLDHNLSLFPNPATDHVLIKIDKNIKVEHLSIYDINGQLIKDQQLEVNDLRLDVHPIATGVYFLHIRSEEGVMKKKLIVVRR